MPKQEVRENVHTPYTDHSISRRPRADSSSPAPAARSLVPFWKGGADERDLGLAYAAVAAGDRGLEQQAIELLEGAAQRDAADLPVLAQLAQLYDRAGDEDKAMRLCERVVRADPAQIAAAINLGVHYMKRGRTGDAMRLWEGALARNPGRADARINLAVAQYRAGDVAGAVRSLKTVLELDPDQSTARNLLVEITNQR
jgi:tetratricopeptide (TPR) repeat protein